MITMTNSSSTAKPFKVVLIKILNYEGASMIREFFRL